jgi:hypothetical protein
MTLFYLPQNKNRKKTKAKQTNKRKGKSRPVQQIVDPRK